MAGLTYIELVAEMVDGTEHSVRCLNIDMVSWDRHRAKFNLPDPQTAPYVWMNYLVWHALKREGAFTGTLGEFEAAAANVGSAPSANGDEATEVNPTSQVAELE